ncbi:glycosyltransferase [Nonomuraea sp. LP-02]|uniref:glycosyltransferase family 4 protein n=1 Tax=Nonomuraea sp. LP-02 TaxID=3097960 RepID=UPI002E2FC9A7|nr:glycosyltransferase [Nonomuraea sp. LP-02]MED7923417.1 glycosyltransferase [Nonomuraea sp. LP-02]
MRVAFVLGTTSGGTGRHVRMLAEGLTRRGHQVLVAGPRSVEEQFAYGEAGARFVEVAVADRPRPAADVRAVLALRRVTRDADVVHAHGLRAGALAALGTWGRRRSPVPLGTSGRRRLLVVTLHNALTAGGLVGFVYGVLERIVARRADRVLVVSPDLGERMTGLGARDVRAAVVPAPPLRPAKRTPREVADELGAGERPILLTVARLAQQKGLETLLDVAVGPWEEALAEFDVAAGPREEALAEFDVSVGPREEALAEFDVSVGPREEALAEFDVSVGPREEASAEFDVSVGPREEVPAEFDVSAGPREEVPAEFDVSAGPREEVPAELDVSAGPREEAPADGKGRAGRGRPLFVVAGEGPLRGELERRIAAEGLPVMLLGNRDDVPDLLGAATAVVTATRWEGQPLSIREALMAGKPVIATAVGGIPEIVGDAGILAPYGDVRALREAVRRLLEEPGTAERLAAAAVRRGREMPDGDEAVESVLNVYETGRIPRDD